MKRRAIIIVEYFSDGQLLFGVEGRREELVVKRRSRARTEDRLGTLPKSSSSDCEKRQIG